MRAMYTTGSGCVKVFTFVSMDYDVDTCAVTLDDGSEEGLHLLEHTDSIKCRPSSLPSSKVTAQVSTS